AYTILGPLQPIASVPYAIRSLNALTASNVASVLSVANLPTNVTLLSSNQIFSASNTFNGVVTATNGSNSFVGAFSGTFAGNGSGLTTLTATNLTGTINDQRLSTNVALQSSANLNFAGSVSATNFTGSGHGLTNVPGAFFWVTASGNVQSFPNVGYICMNDTNPVTVTLPSSPSVGDTFKVAGVGAGGWNIAQNAGQSILSGNLAGNVGMSWKAVGLNGNWTAIACSADGTKLAATIGGSATGNLWVSTNSAFSWTSRATVQTWSSIAASADGTKWIAAVGYTPNSINTRGGIYRSTDSGTTWNVTSAPSTNWSAVASSADGTRLLAVARTGQIYFSVNGGSAWTAVGATGGSFFWRGCASSADGTNLLAVGEGGYVVVSSDGGATWVQRTNYLSQLISATMSADGNREIVTGNGGQVYLSTDAGTNWIQAATLGSQGMSIASSADGARLAAAVGDATATGNVYSSADSGSVWKSLAGAPVLMWSGIASSADGSVLAACVYGGSIYLSSQSSTTTGVGGYLFGQQHSAIELIYVGNGVFLPLNHEGTIRAY
ncbi:MAG TPA: hypothetical protein VN625_07880, partial [Desulfuromonadaceae bacterium]|nr:hypothetical protein [Desulfuromonadaceae bacterium]